VTFVWYIDRATGELLCSGCADGRDAVLDRFATTDGRDAGELFCDCCDDNIRLWHEEHEAQ